MPADSNAQKVHAEIMAQPILGKLLAFIIGIAMDNQHVEHLSDEEEAEVYDLLAEDARAGLAFYR